MASVTGMTAARMFLAEASRIIDAEVVDGNLIIHKADGTFINAGNVRGVAGDSNSLVTELGNAVNLNTITTPGLYSQSSTAEAAAGTNYPPALQAGMLTVTSNGSNMIWQKYHVYNGSNFANSIWTRTSYNGTWSAWSGTRGGAWTNISLASDWTAYGNPYQTPQFRVDGSVMRLRGLARKGTGVTAGSVIATFGSPYAPLSGEIFACCTSQSIVSGAASAGTAHTHTSVNYAGRVDINSAGNLTLQASATSPLGNGGWVSLDGIFWDWTS